MDFQLRLHFITLLHLTDYLKIFAKKAEDYVLMSINFPVTLVLLKLIIFFLLLLLFFFSNCKVEVTTAGAFRVLSEKRIQLLIRDLSGKSVLPVEFANFL